MTESYLFIHVPKTGGVSFDALLTGIFREDEICPAYYEQDCLTPRLNLARYRLFRGHHSYFVSTALSPGTKVVTFLRHPVPRAMSAYEHILRDKSHPRHQLMVEQTRSLADFVRHPFLGQQVCNTQTRMIGRSVDFAALRNVAITGSDFLERTKTFIEILRTIRVTAEELTVAKERLRQMAFFGLTERFDESCRRFLDLLGQKAGLIEKLNQTPASFVDRRDQYTPADIAAVKEGNEFDLEFYDFAIQLFDEVERSKSEARGLQ